MIKYLIIKDVPDGYGGNLSESKLVRKYELRHYLDNDWYVKKKIIPIITPFVDWWKRLNNMEKLTFFGIIVSSLVVSFFGLLSHLTNKEIDSLKLENKTLNENYNRLKQTLILTSDSLNIEREKTEQISKQLQSSKESYKTEVDSLKK